MTKIVGNMEGIPCDSGGGSVKSTNACAARSQQLTSAENWLARLVCLSCVPFRRSIQTLPGSGTGCGICDVELVKISVPENLTAAGPAWPGQNRWGPTNAMLSPQRATRSLTQKAGPRTPSTLCVTLCLEHRTTVLRRAKRRWWD